MTDTAITIGMPLDEALTSSNTVTACLARFGASAAMEEMTKLINAELERDTSLATIFTAIAVFSVQIHSGLAAQTLTMDGCEKSQRLFQSLVTDEYLEHAQRTKNALKAEAAL